MIPYLREEPVRGAGDRALDVEGGDNHLVGVHVQRGVREEDGLVGEPAGHGSPHAGGHVGEDCRRDAAQDQRPHQPDLGGGAYYGPPVSWLHPVPLLVEGVDEVGPLRGHGCGARDDVPQAGCQAALDGQGEALVRFGQESVNAGYDPFF